MRKKKWKSNSQIVSEIQELSNLVKVNGSKLTNPLVAGSTTTLKSKYTKHKAKSYINCFKVRLYPTEVQRDILLCWFDATTEMSNATIDRINELRSDRNKWSSINKNNEFALIEDNPLFTQYVRDESDEEYVINLESRKSRYKNSQIRKEESRLKYNLCFNYKLLRSNELLDIKRQIQEKSYIRRHEKNKSFLNYPETQYLKNHRIFAHILDASIKYVCAHYITMIKNYKSGYIRKYTLRHLKYNRKYKVFEIGNDIFAGSALREIFGGIEAYRQTKDGFIPYDFYSTTTTSTIKYDSKKEEFYMFVSRTLEVEKCERTKKFACIDPGVRVPLTGMTENSFFDFAEEVPEKLYDMYNHLHYIKHNENIPCKIKKKHRKRAKFKIKNMIDDFHWETANFLSKYAEVIYFGHINVQSIIAKGGNIPKITKKVFRSLRFGEMIEKIKYKCCSRNTAFILVDESFTTKMCSFCGNYNPNFGSSKIYQCSNCKISVDRDMNSCRNIYLKSTLDKYRR